MGNTESAGVDFKIDQEFVQDIKNFKELNISRRLNHSQYLKHIQGELNETCLSDLPWSVLDYVSFYERIDASFNSISHFSPQIPYRLPHLVHLNLSYNCLTAIPPSIGLLFHLRELLVRNNQLTSLPKELAQLPSLELLDLSHNRLENLPQNLGNLPRLTSLNVSHNNITELPLSLGNCETLKTLVATKNRWSNPLQDVCERGSDALLEYLRSKAPAVKVMALNQFPRVRLNVTQSAARQDSRGSNAKVQTRDEVPVSRTRTPLRPPPEASRYDLDSLEDKIIGLVYGAVLGDSLGLGTEFLSRDETNFYYGNSRLCHENIVQDEHRAHFMIGEWTCVSDLMLLVMESMLQWAGVVDELDLASKLIQYKKTGLKDLHREAPFITSTIIHAVLNEDDFSQDPHATSQRIANNLNAAVAEDLHALPMALFTGVSFFHNLDEVASTAERVCKTTHNHPHAKAAAAVLAVILACTLQGKEVDDILNAALESGLQLLNSEEDARLLTQSLQPDTYKTNRDSAFDVVSAAAYSVSQKISQKSDFDRVLMEVLFRGGQSRLYGAVCGAILGCQLGYSSLNSRWIEGLKPRHVKWLNEKVNLLLDIMGMP